MIKEGVCTSYAFIFYKKSPSGVTMIEGRRRQMISRGQLSRPIFNIFR